MSVVDREYVAQSLSRAIRGASAAESPQIAAREAGGSLIVEVSVQVVRPHADPVRVTGSVAIPISGADAMSAHDFEVDVARVLEEYLVTDALEPTANGSVEYAGWTFEVSMT